MRLSVYVADLGRQAYSNAACGMRNGRFEPGGRPLEEVVRNGVNAAPGKGGSLELRFGTQRLFVRKALGDFVQQLLIRVLVDAAQSDFLLG